MSKYKPLTDQEIRSFRARGINDRLLEEDHDWHRKKVEIRRSKEKSLIETIAALNARISELNVVIASRGL